MKRTFNLLVLVTLLVLTFGAQGVTPAQAATPAVSPAYIRSTVGAPWDESTNEAAMDAVFGAGNWDDLRYESVVPATLFSSSYDFIFMEGGDNNADELEAFLTANQAALEAWVAGGGKLLLNSAPNEGDGMAFGFGGVQLNYPGASSENATAVNPSHPIFNGPFLPAGTSYTGGGFSHATVSGGSASAVITGDSGTILSELSWGGGCAMFGGMTTSNFHNPQPNGDNLRANILDYLRNNCGGFNPADNLLKKPDFASASIFPNPWQLFGVKRPYASALDCAVFQTAACSVYFPSGNRSAMQRVVRSGLAGDTYFFGLSSMSQNAPIGGNYRVEVTFYNNFNRPVGTTSVSFNPLTHGWETASGFATATGNYNKIVFRFYYQNSSGRAWFDDAFLIVAP